MPENECFPDPESMSDSEKIELIESLHSANHTLIDSNQWLVQCASGLAWSMDKLADALNESNQKGLRKEALNLVEMKLRVLSGIALAQLGISRQDIEEADAFGKIVEELEGDPALQFPPEE